MMAHNAANRKSVREAEKKARLRERETGDLLRSLMSTPSGRSWIWDRLAAAHVFATIPPTDPVVMAYAEGERNQGLQLLNDIMLHCPDHFIQAMREQNERHALDQHDADASDSAARAEYSGSEDAGRDAEGPVGDPTADYYQHPDYDDLRPAQAHGVEYNPTARTAGEA